MTKRRGSQEVDCVFFANNLKTHFYLSLTSAHSLSASFPFFLSLALFIILSHTHEQNTMVGITFASQMELEKEH